MDSFISKKHGKIKRTGVPWSLNQEIMNTVQDFQEAYDGTQHGKELNKQLALATRHRGGVKFGEVEVVSKSEMGHDGGDCNLRTHHVRVSEAMMKTREGVAKVAEVIIHEDFHRGNQTVGGTENDNEGFVQWLTLDTLQAANNSAYQEEVGEIEVIANKIGREKVRAIGHDKNPVVNLWMAYVHKLIESGMEMDKAAEEGNQRIAAAA